VFDDDEQVGPPSGDQRQATASSRSGGTLAVKSREGLVHTSRDNFAVLVHVQARGMTDGEAASGDAPLDLVTVLDVSGSMTGAKLALLKQAVGFVIDNLRPQDRLSVVSISSGGRRVTRLLRMSGTGKATTKRGSNIAEGLRTAAKVLVDRRRRNTMSSVILLSDGRPGHQHRMTPRWLRGTAPNYEAILHVHWLAPEIGRRRLTRVDSATTTMRPPCMHVIAEATAGRRSSRTRSRSASAACSPSWCRTRASPSLAGIPEFVSARSSPSVTDNPPTSTAAPLLSESASYTRMRSGVSCCSCLS